MSDLGMMHYFLGLQVMQYVDGVFISQKKYVQEILDRFQMSNYNPVTSPTEVGLKLTKNPEGKKIDGPLYKQIVGSLMYLTATRPNIMHVGEKSDLIGFTNSDYAGDLNDWKSTLRYAFMLSSWVVSWSSKKQPIITLSTTEPEFVATSTYCRMEPSASRSKEGVDSSSLDVPTDASLEVFSVLTREEFKRVKRQFDVRAEVFLHATWSSRHPLMA
ncbi:uncharacterized protein LOC116125078 [Pistacia vera]|uniref:uncharacterized protein LOC116125078 n=1 Tax=Pistacia vera TaxID=55513 RepID=UPI00126349C8|nr:uncharacterized protein LOC116125078 [Pistacia vera]